MKLSKKEKRKANGENADFTKAAFSRGTWEVNPPQHCLEKNEAPDLVWSEAKIFASAPAKVH